MVLFLFHQEAGYVVIFCDLNKFWVLFLTDILLRWAAGKEPAPWRWVDGTRSLPCEGKGRFTLLDGRIGHGYGGKQALGVRMLVGCI